MTLGGLGRHLRWSIAVVLPLMAQVLVAPGSAAAAPSANRTQAVAARPSVPFRVDARSTHFLTQSSRFGFDFPASTASDGTHLWVLNEGVDTLSEISESSGTLQRTIDLPSIGWDAWARLAASANDLWVLDTYGITEIAKATGRIVKTIPEAGGGELYSDGTHLWAAVGEAVVEVDEASGAVVRVLNSPEFYDIQTLIAVGWHLWVMNYAFDPFGPSHGSLVEVDIATGRVLRVLSNTLDIGQPLGMASDGSHLWVAQLYAPSMELNQVTGSLIRSFPPAWAVTYGGGHVWFTSQVGPDIEVNPASGKVVHSLSSGFDWPYAIEADGTHVWVPNYYGNSVTEMSESAGSIVRILSDPPYGFDDPSPIAFADGDLWIANSTTLSETSANGTLLRTVELPYEAEGGAGSLVADASHLWLVDANDTVSEFDESDGALVQVLSNPSYGFDEPEAIAADGTHLWVTNFGGGSVTELDESDGSLVQVLSGASYGFDGPLAITVDGAHVWVVNYGGSVTELNQANGSAVQIVTAAAGGFDHPDAVVADGSRVWVLNGGSSPASGSVSELNDAGTKLKVLAGAAFGFDYPQSIVADGHGHLWVASFGSTLTEVDELTGSSLRRVSNGIEEYNGVRTLSLASESGILWAADGLNEAVAQLSESSGRVDQVLVG